MAKQFTDESFKDITKEGIGLLTDIGIGVAGMPTFAIF